MNALKPDANGKDKLGMGYILLAAALLAIIVIGYKSDIMRMWGDKSGNSGDVAHIQEIVKTYLDENPDVIVEAIKKYGQKIQADHQQKATDFVAKNNASLNADKPFIGNPTGGTIITVFYDYRCGYCKKAHADMDKLVKENSDVKVVYIDAPVLGPQSVYASKAGLAVFEIQPADFGKFQNELMELSQIDEKAVTAIAKKLKIDVAKLTETMNSEKIQKAMDNNAEIVAQIGVRGVPGFIVKDQFIPGYIGYEEMKKKITVTKD